MKVVIADSKQGKSYQVELDELKSKPFYGRTLGSKAEGALIGLTGYTLELTGGTDRDGFPMRKDVHGTDRKRVLLSGKPGFKPKSKGHRERKTVRGTTVGEDIAQLNVKAVEYGPKTIAELLGIQEKKPEEIKEEKETKE